MIKIPKEHCYPFVLDQKPTFILGWILDRLFMHVQVDESMVGPLREMQEKGTVVYAIKYRSVLDYLLLHYLFQQKQLPYPMIGFDLNVSWLLPITRYLGFLRFYLSSLFHHKRFPNPTENGFFLEALGKGTSFLFCLVDPKGFSRQFIHARKDHLLFLLETQKHMDRPIHILPQLIVYDKAPEKENPSLLDIFFGYKDKAGFIRKTVLFFRHHRRAFIDFGRPLNLMTYLSDQPLARGLEEMGMEVRRDLIDRIDEQKRVILGPVMKSRQQIKEMVLQDKDITQTVEQMAEGDGRRRRVIRRELGKIFDKIAADYNPTYVQFASILLSWLWKKIFEGIDVDQAEMAMVREWARKGPCIYVPSHKSHIDYLVLNYILYYHHTHMPRIAAGENLAFWPMGHFFRKSGAFFIRRTFAGAKLYTKVFTRYIKALVHEGYSLEFFIEGGRSRSGKLILPKVGLLSTLLQAHQEGYCHDLIFIPASISYDRILEEKSHLKEVMGAQKEKESFRRIWQARGFLKRKYGKIYIRFGQPLSLREHLEKEGYSRGGTVRRLAFHLVRSINRVTLVTPFTLVAVAILNRHRRGFHIPDLLATIQVLMHFLKRYEIPTAPTLMDVEQAARDTLSLLLNWKIVSTLEAVEGEETFYYLDEEKVRELEYYKNCIIHFFLSHAFVAVSVLSGTEEKKTRATLLEDYAFLKELFQNEFVYDEALSPEEEVDRATQFFLETNLLIQSNGGLRISRLGFDLLPLWASMAKTFLEAYWITTRAYMGKGKLNKKKSDLLKNMRVSGLRFHKLGIIDHLEAVSQVTFTNATHFVTKEILARRGVAGEPARDPLEALTHLSQRLYALSHYKG